MHTRKINKLKQPGHFDVFDFTNQGGDSPQVLQPRVLSYDEQRALDIAELLREEEAYERGRNIIESVLRANAQRYEDEQRKANPAAVIVDLVLKGESGIIMDMSLRAHDKMFRAESSTPFERVQDVLSYDVASPQELMEGVVNDIFSAEQLDEVVDIVVESSVAEIFAACDAYEFIPELAGCMSESVQPQGEDIFYRQALLCTRAYLAFEPDLLYVPDCPNDKVGRVSDDLDSHVIYLPSLPMWTDPLCYSSIIDEESECLANEMSRIWGTGNPPYYDVAAKFLKNVEKQGIGLNPRGLRYISLAEYGVCDEARFLRKYEDCPPDKILLMRVTPEVMARVPEGAAVLLVDPPSCVGVYFFSSVREKTC